MFFLFANFVVVDPIWYLCLRRRRPVKKVLSFQLHWKKVFLSVPISFQKITFLKKCLSIEMSRCNQYFIGITEKKWASQEKKNCWYVRKVALNEICPKPSGNNTNSKQLRFNYYFREYEQETIFGEKQKANISEIHWVKRKSIVPKQITKENKHWIELCFFTRSTECALSVFVIFFHGTATVNNNRKKKPPEWLTEKWKSLI